jgi:transposase
MLDVHARSLLAQGVDWQSGQRFSQRLVPVNEDVVDWAERLPGPVAVAYEAGPTGFGLARAFRAVGIRCVVVTPSKMERPLGDRIKTDKRDAARLARLLHIGELPEVRVPTEEEEAARARRSTPRCRWVRAVSVGSVRWSWKYRVLRDG